MDSSISPVKDWTSLQETMGPAKKRAMKSLINEYLSLLDDPAEGFVVKVDNPFVWDIGIYGPPSTPYWGGYFKAQVKFPDDYPFEPPKIRFKSKFFHPNVYETGTVCMSILHNPLSEDVPSDLPVEEKWNPTLSVRTVLLSLISILGSPNIDSPANLEATKMFRLWKERGDESYNNYISYIVKKSKKLAKEDGVLIPTTLDEYIEKTKVKSKTTSLVEYNLDIDEFSTCSSEVSLSNSDDDTNESSLIPNSMETVEPDDMITEDSEQLELTSQADLSSEFSQSSSSLLQNLSQYLETTFTPNTTQSPDSLSITPSSSRKRPPPNLRMFSNSDGKKRKKQ